MNTVELAGHGPPGRTAQRRVRRRTWLLTLACTLALPGSIAAPAGAAEFNVVLPTDPALRAAVTAANASTDPANTITFGTLPGAFPITLLSTLPDVIQDLEIDGSTTTNLQITGPAIGTAIYQIDANIALSLIDAPFTMGDVVLGDDAVVVFVTSLDQSLDEVIREGVGAMGALEKRGDAELTLTGANSYTGGTTVHAGTLVVTTTSLPGGATVTADATLAFDEPLGATFMDAIIGAGALEKRGAGSLLLTGANNYSGGTTVVEGILRGEPGSITGDLAVESLATLELSVPTDTSFDGLISGDGTFHKSGAGRLTLAPALGSNSISSFRVSAGILDTDTAGLANNTAIDTGALVIVNEPASATFGGVLSGAGAVLKQGSGELTLTGANTFSGPLTINAGAIIGTSSSVPNTIDTDVLGVLAFDIGATDRYAGAISGDGRLEKRGNGTLELDGVQAFTGVTRVDAGRLDLTGSIPAGLRLVVRKGATLGGTGSFGGLVRNRGTVAPGTSIGTLTVDSIEFPSSGVPSTLSVEVEPGGASDLLSVTNTADLTGGALDVTLAGGAYTGQTFTVLSAGTRIGQLAFTNDFAFVDIAPTYAGGDLVLTVTGNSATFESFAENRNQEGVARSLDQEAPTATPDMQTVLDAFASLSRSEVGAAYDALGGEQVSQLTTARFELADRLDRTLHARVREQGDALELPTERARNGLPAVSYGGDSGDSALWLEPFAIFGAIDGRQGAHDTDYTLAGVTLGGDFDVLEGVRAGAAFSYGHVDLDYDALAGTGGANSYTGALYGGWSNEWLRVGLSSRVGYSDMETRRDIAIGTLRRTADADFNGLDAGGRLEAGAKLLRSSRYLVEPFVAVGYTHLERSQIHESGAGSVNLRVEREKLDSATVGAGLRARAIFRLESDFVLIPELHGQWNQQLADRDRRVDASFQDALTGSSFSVWGTELHRNAGTVGIDWSVRNERGFDARLGYDVGFDADRVAHALAVILAFAW